MLELHLFQPNYEFSGTAWLPYSAACLWAYAAADPVLQATYELRELHYRRQSYESVLERLTSPAVVAFSTYVWNATYNRGLAARIKERWPAAHVVFGGPEVPNDARAFLADNPAIDCVVHREGEVAFASLLHELNRTDAKLARVPGISFRDPCGEVVTTASNGRVENLDILPSPYLTGVFDRLLRDNPETLWAATLETNRGCPYKCHFCDWGSLVFAKVKLFDEARVGDELDWLAANPVDYIFVADANFGMFRQRDARLVERMLEMFQRCGRPCAFCVQWTKSSNRQVVDLARRLGPAHKGLTLSVQSMSTDVLAAIERKNMPIQNLREMLQLAEEAGVPAYTELILGLPQETRGSWRDSLHQLLELGQHSAIDVWIAQVLQNSEMGSAAALARHQIETVPAQGYFFGANVEGTDDIQESIQLVRATRTLPFEDLIDSYLYAWMIMNLHIYGWTQLAARFLRRHAGVGFETFYGALFEHIRAAPHGWLGRELKATRALICRYLTEGELQANLRDEIGVDLGIAGHNLMWRSQMIWRFHGAAVLAEVDDFVNDVAGDLDRRGREDLRLAQRHAVVLHAVRYPFEFEIGSNLVDAALADSAWDRGRASRYRVDYRPQLLEQVPNVAGLRHDELLRILYAKRRSGAGIAAMVSLDESKRAGSGADTPHTSGLDSGGSGLVGTG